MSWKSKTAGGLLTFTGFMLSPLSWWNDLFVNIPIATVFAWLISAFYKPAFYPALFVGYWITNVLGFVLMHKGAQKIFLPEKRKTFRRELITDILISLIYTGIIFVMVEFGVLKPFSSYINSTQ